MGLRSYGADLAPLYIFRAERTYPEHWGTLMIRNNSTVWSASAEYLAEEYREETPRRFRNVT